MEGDDSKPADDDDREGVAEGQHGQGLLQHGLQINVVPGLGIFVFFTGFRSHDINIKKYSPSTKHFRKSSCQRPSCYHSSSEEDVFQPAGLP